MANVVAMAGTCDDYNIETRNDNVSKLKAILPHKEARAMSILQRASS